MALADFAAGLQRPLGHLVDALGDPRRQHRTAAALIVIYVVLWWAYAVVAKGTQGIHLDMAEVYAWSREPSFGYFKHPPLSAWVAAVWFTMFPSADWAFYLLSVACVGVALWFVWLIAARYTESGAASAVALMFLAFAPVFNFLPLKYNTNSLLIPVWALASWLFLRSFERRTLLWGALAGLGAAAAMLTKYWSFFLLLGLAAAALADPRRKLYFCSPAPWASIVAGAALFAPNIVWLVTHDFGPFRYATSAHTVRSYADSLLATGRYLSGALYLAGGFLALALAAKPDLQTWRDMLWPQQAERRFLLIVLLTSLLMPIAVALALKMETDPLWTMPCWAMLPAMLLSSPRVLLTRKAACSVVAAAYAVGVFAIAVSPAVAIMVIERGSANSAIYYPQVAGEAELQWRQSSDKPMRYVAGTEYLAWACTFYCRDHPRALAGFSFAQAPWIDQTEMQRQGFVGLCEADDRPCLDRVRNLAGSGATLRAQTVELKRRGFGIDSEPRRFTFLVVLPRS